MNKKIFLAAIVVFVLWAVLAFIIHGVMLKAAYASTAQLWRPMAEMKMGLMYVSIFIAALAFSAIYGFLVTKKSLMAGLTYGLLYGIAVGVGMGYGSYSTMPIPYSMALTWFLGTVIEAILGGLVLGAIIKN
ncbi:MAG: hypothetical protein A2V86_11835 [Deltaproteobacteria bacterium RBG_16_49_23]|nr:MAG: hypothetical protein A2V86_11835 [Deltaproteobacteria bacterium RBG_16_49_23]